MKTSALDKRGILSFLIITFAITYIIEGLLIASGVRFVAFTSTYAQFVVAGMMWAPALATVVTIRFVTREGFAITNVRFGSWKPYLTSALVIPALFVVIYALTALLGFGNPDWRLVEFYSMISPYVSGTAGAMPPSNLVLLLVFIAGLFISPFFNTFFAFGEEIGWRGYLLPKLMPLGKPKAYLLVSIIWGLWHLPLVWIGFTFNSSQRSPAPAIAQ